MSPVCATSPSPQHAAHSFDLVDFVVLIFTVLLGLLMIKLFWTSWTRVAPRAVLRDQGVQADVASPELSSVTRAFRQTPLPRAVISDQCAQAGDSLSFLAKQTTQTTAAPTSSQDTQTTPELGFGPVVEPFQVVGSAVHSDV